MIIPVCSLSPARSREDQAQRTYALSETEAQTHIYLLWKHELCFQWIWVLFCNPSLSDYVTLDERHNIYKPQCSHLYHRDNGYLMVSGFGINEMIWVNCLPLRLSCIARAQSTLIISTVVINIHYCGHKSNDNEAKSTAYKILYSLCLKHFDNRLSCIHLCKCQNK